MDYLNRSRRRCGLSRSAGIDACHLTSSSAMKKYIALCFASAVVGGMTALVVTDNLFSPPTAALEAESQRGDSPRAGRPGEALAARPFDPRVELPADEYTADEQVNIAVYENVNRSVVNINTKTTRGDAF